MPAAAREHVADLVIVLMPNGTNPEILQDEFVGVREVLRNTGVRVVDMTTSYAGPTASITFMPKASARLAMSRWVATA